MSEAPKTLTLNGVEYAVKFVSDLGSEPDADGKRVSWFGHISHTKREIEIEADMHVGTQKVGVLHEIMHGMMHQGGHHDIDEWVEDKMIVCLSHGIVSLLRDNPEFTRYILSDDSIIDNMEASLQHILHTKIGANHE